MRASITLSDQAKNILLYPCTLLTRLNSLTVAGTGKIKTALLALKTRFFAGNSPVSQKPPPLSLLNLPRKIINKVMKKLDLPDASALINTCSRIRNCYTPEQRNWLNIKKNCLMSMNRHRSNANRISTPKQFYREILTRLLNPQAGDQEIKHMAARAEKFCEYLPQAKVKKLLYQTLLQQPLRDFRRQWEKLAHFNFRLCVILSGIATPDELAQNNSLLTLLSTDPVKAKAFLHRLEREPYGDMFYNKTLSHVVNKRFIEAASPILQTYPGFIDIPDNKNLTVLQRAILHHNNATVRLLLENEANVNLRNAAGNTALINTCIEGENEIVEVLLSHGADTELRSRHNQTALMKACAQGSTTVVQLLLQYGAQTHPRDRWGGDALAVAKRMGHPDIVQLLINHQPVQITLFTDSAAMEQTVSPVSLQHFSAEIAHEVTKWLGPRDTLAFINTCSAIRNLFTPERITWLGIEKKCLALISKAYPTISDRHTLRRCYHEALSRLLNRRKASNKELKHLATFAEKFHTRLSSSEIREILSSLLKQLARYNLQPQWERLARINFHLCVTLSGIMSMDQLARHKINCDFLLARLSPDRTQAVAFLNNAEDWSIRPFTTALSYAASRGYTEIVSALLKANPGCIDIPTRNNLTALMCTAQTDNVTIAHLLLEHKANVNLQNTIGNTALMYACSSGKNDLAQILLTHGADIEQQDKKGQTALMIATRAGHKATVQLLLQHGANVNAKGLNGKNVRFLARISSHEIAQLLEKHRQQIQAGRLT